MGGFRELEARNMKFVGGGGRVKVEMAPQQVPSPGWKAETLSSRLESRYRLSLCLILGGIGSSILWLYRDNGK